MKLVRNWKHAWKWISMWCMGAAGALEAAWLAVPQHLLKDIPDEYKMAVTIALLVLGFVGRMVDQGSDE